MANKMDLDGALENLNEFKKKVNVPIYPVSALKEEGIDEVLIKVADLLDTLPKKPLYEEEKFESHVLYQFKQEKPFTIHRENNTWIIRGEKVEKLLRMTKFQSDESALRFAHQLKRMGIDEELRKQGINEGDTVQILDYEFEYKE